MVKKWDGKRSRLTRAGQADRIVVDRIHHPWQWVVG